MKTLVFDCAVGSQATRILAALLDVGADAARLDAALEALPWAKGLRLRSERRPCGGLMGTCLWIDNADQPGSELTEYGYEHDHDLDLSAPLRRQRAPVWGQMHEHEQLIEGLLPEWQSGFSPEQAIEALAPAELAPASRSRLEQMIYALAAMRQTQPSGEIKRHELMLMLGLMALLESLGVERVWVTPVCVAEGALSRAMLSGIAQGRVPLPCLEEEGLTIGYGHDGGERTVPDVLRACLGFARHGRA